MKLNLFLLLCLAGVISVTLPAVRHDYYLITTPATWADARTYCRNTYDDLATVSTDDDFERLEAEAERKALPATGWVGLFDRSSSWYWAYPYQSVSVTNWAPGQPDNVGGKESCGVMNADGSWDDYPCSDLKPWICYNATSESFIAVPDSLNTWSGSRGYCRRYHTEIACALNQTMSDELQQMVSLQGTSWIGLGRHTWRWSNWGSTYNLRWSPGFPNNANHPSTCASVNNSLLMDRQCDNLFNFFCHTYLTVKVQTVKLKIQGDNSVFDPAVQSAILQQILQKLQDKGITKETKVTWRVQSDGNIFHKKSKDYL